MSGLLVYRTPVHADWIDYNGHLRDAYYAVAVSLGLDALMDQVGLDEAYRTQTHCTLYSVEMHLHWLQEVKAPAELELYAHVLDLDSKRLQVGMDIKVKGLDHVAASAETMLVHVSQHPSVKTTAFPEAIRTQLERLKLQSPDAWQSPRSRPLAILRKTSTPA